MASTETIEQVKQRIEEVDPAEARDELKGGGVALVDTREPNEYMEAHIDGAELVRPVDVADRIEEVVPEHSQRVILYCASGNRSARAADQLARARLRERRIRARAASRPGRPRAFPSSCPRA